MPENLEAEVTAKEAAAKEKIIDLIRETIQSLENEKLGQYLRLNPTDMADQILGMPGNDLADKARIYFDDIWVRGGEIINELPQEFQQEAKDRMYALGKEVEKEMRKIEE